MRIKKKFLQLTKKTYPLGTESQLEKFLPSGWKKDDYGNYYVIVGKDFTTMFTCHLDTYTKGAQQEVVHRFNKNIIYTDGRTILGADDKAGMVVLLYMISKKVPGLYYFFLAEESGCIGSKKVAQSWSSGDILFPELEQIKKVVSFDRKGTSSVITEQLYTECCSIDFAAELVDRLNTIGNGLFMRMDNNGFSTDSAQFMGIVPECTNISVGYYDEHTISERQDIDHLYKLCHAVVEINWETLPVKRTPEEPFGCYYPPKKTKTYYNDWEAPFDNSFVDEFSARFNKNYYTFLIDPFDGVRKQVYISSTWVHHERILIEQGLKREGRNIKSLQWDGTSCWLVEHNCTTSEYMGNRTDVSRYLHKGGEIPETHLYWTRRKKELGYPVY
jgi:hypothetical protein